MACNHRFLDFLIPNKKNIKFLFIGTFNPEWSAENKNNADYFYGRKTSQFWCILPHAFEQNSLIHKGKIEWKTFADENGVGFSDIVKGVKNADETLDDHKYALTKGFSDDNLEKKEFSFDLDFNTIAIKKVVSENESSLDGVFFTRSTEGKLKRIWSEWNDIVLHCNTLNIYSKALITPSSRYGNVVEKIDQWKSEINLSKQKSNFLKNNLS